FNAAEAVILPQDYAVLDKVVSILAQVPALKLEVSSHTDSKGSNESNLALSKKRADAVVAYLVSKKIDAKRLVPVGYGETKLLNKCKDGVECTEEEHAKNRRVEFKVIK
ncbi:MAG: OmpA family protein, partial [Bdellovibrionales bacterium]